MTEGNPLVGKRITAVYLAEGGDAIRFDIEGGEPIIAQAWGDCCSRTWIEDIEGPERMLGTVTKVENLAMLHETPDGEYGDVIRHYGLQVTTDKGSAVIDYRHSSNGYYGGDLAWPGDPWWRSTTYTWERKVA